MDWDKVEGNWKQFKGQIQQKWGHLTDDDLEGISGRREQLEGKIQERYGIEWVEVKKEVDHWLKGDTVEYVGRVVRVEPDGFGIIEFDGPIGVSGNTHGVISSSTSSVVPLGELRPGVHVKGTAESDPQEVASIKTVDDITRSP
jgi:uncharacterized protein YjbJ (UPF0337 family)